MRVRYSTSLFLSAVSKMANAATSGTINRPGFRLVSGRVFSHILIVVVASSVAAQSCIQLPRVITGESGPEGLIGEFAYL